MQYTNDLCPRPGRPENANMNNLPRNLRDLMDAVKVSENELSRRTGIPQPTIHRILNNKVDDPRDGTLRPLAAYFGVSVEELRTQIPDGSAVREPGPSAPPYAAAETVDVEIKPLQELLIPEVEVRPSPGPGAAEPSLIATRNRIPCPVSWFQERDVRPFDAIAMRVTVKNMERTLFPGDRIIVDTADREIVDGRVYVLATGGVEPDVKIKRLFTTTSGRIRAVNDHPDKALYPDEHLDATDMANIHIVGRVIDRSGHGGL